MPYKKKLIEVAIPLEAINAASAREKSIRHGHPSTLHLWWARRPLAACRAVLFAQLVDDPSSRVEELLADPALRAQAEAALPARVAAWEISKAAAKGTAASAPRPTLTDVVVEIERKRLFAIIEDLVLWENSTNEEVLERARAEIRKSCGGELPPVYDPFSGGCSIPLEAQRLGLPAYGSDLNPVAVMIGKAMIEIPPKFKDMPPIHPGPKDRAFYRNAEGLAEDVKYYGEWMREKAWERIGHLYPQVDLPAEYGGGKATVIAWIWARTVPSPDPAFADVQVPIVSSFLLSSKVGKQAWIEPEIDKVAKSITYAIRTDGTKDDVTRASEGTKSGHGANFRCLISGAPVVADYIRECGQGGRIGESLLAIVASGSRGKIYLSPNLEHERIARQVDRQIGPDICFEPEALGFRIGNYGMKKFGDMFMDRQILALNTFSDLVKDVYHEVLDHAKKLDVGGLDPKYYAKAVSVYLAFSVDRCADYWTSLGRWQAANQQFANLFGRQAIPMVWDYPEANPFSDQGGSFKNLFEWTIQSIGSLGAGVAGTELQSDAQTLELKTGAVVSTDPPYYDNIGYADLSDFFYYWMKRSLKDAFPEIFSVLATPKAEELVATPCRHGGRDSAEAFFLGGMKRAFQNLCAQMSTDFPCTIYYAFKQSEIEEQGVSSTGWATFLEAVILSDFQVTQTWPVRTELANRMRGNSSNALANSVVLVCRKKDPTAGTITRAEFIRALKRELPPAIAELQAANIAPADMPQSAIGPGMGVFSRYKAVLESDDSKMSVKTALQLINAELDEYLGGIQGEFDADTRFAITWFEQNGMGKGDYGVADNLARARGISVESVKHAGIVDSAAGKVRLLKRDELDPDWVPEGDGHLTIWECLAHLVRLHEAEGLSHNTALLLKRFGPQADAVKDLAYCLYDIAANKRREAAEATPYNALIADWSELSQMAATVALEGRNRQMMLEV